MLFRFLLVLQDVLYSGLEYFVLKIWYCFSLCSKLLYVFVFLLQCLRCGPCKIKKESTHFKKVVQGNRVSQNAERNYGHILLNTIFNKIVDATSLAAHYFQIPIFSYTMNLNKRRNHISKSIILSLKHCIGGPGAAGGRGRSIHS